MKRSPIASLLASAAVLCAPSPASAAPDGVLLSADELSAAIGADLSVEQWALSSPNGPSQTTPQECRAASNATTTLVYGAMWTSYQGSSFADGEGDDYHVVAGQIVGVFPTAKAASDVFAALTKGLRSCGSKTSVEHRAGGNLTWRNAVDQIGTTTASWHSLLDNRPRWRCSLAAQLSDNAVVEASVCRFVDPASATQASTLANQVRGIAKKLVARAS
ncbi:MAG: sensor domain-containing protein [Segniliparus sp.]|uniref:sensor domain-containing protein n=1 Tax=Segniliparus sp. TaxID=2804064 RepID=UPI003F34AD29